MPRLIPTLSIGVSRKVGTRTMTIFPPIGELFDFTDEEVKQFHAEHPAGLRRPVNEAARASESGSEVTSEEDDASEEDEVTTLEEGGTETSRTQSTRYPTAQQQRQAAAAARRAGVRRTPDEDDL